jgi:teichuronic acid biosynthesis glycosyltransferase TuaC
MLDGFENSASSSVPLKKSSLQPLRVLSVIPGDPGDPSNMVFARRQVNALRERGVDNHCFFLKSRTSPKSLLSELRRFRREVRRIDPHIVHAQVGTMTAFFCAAATKRPLVISFRGSDLNPCPDVSRLRSVAGHLLSHIATIRAKHIICVSQELRNRIWLRSRPVSIIFDGVNLSVFRPVHRDEARYALGWEREKKLVFFNFGGRPAGKRLDLAEGAVEFARKYLPEIELLPLTKVNPERVPLIMNACDCLLLTSDWEGSPTVVKEALACGLPVVSVDVGDVKAQLEGVYPSKVVPRDVEAIGSAVVEILRLGVRSDGPAQARRVSEQSTISSILHVYEQVMASCP